jgi:hypothetical protein
MLRVFLAVSKIKWLAYIMQFYEFLKCLHSCSLGQYREESSSKINAGL